MKPEQKQLALLAGGGGGAFLLYRYHKQRQGQGTTPQHVPSSYPPVTNGGAFGQLAPYTPQDPVVLQPGESVYDPNPGNLLNTPTAGTAGNPLPQPAPRQAASAAAPAYVVKVNYARPMVRARRPNRHPHRRKRPNRKKVNA